MGGIRTLAAVQLGKETTEGTAVAATTIWRGPAAMPDDQRSIVFAEENVGIAGGVDRTYTERIEAILALTETEATFEQFPYLLNASVEGQAGSQDGAGTDYIFTYDFPTTSKNTIYTYAVEAGDDQQYEKAANGFVEEWALTGEGGGPLMMSGNVRLAEWSKVSKTGGLSIPSVEEIIFNKGKLYIDDSGGTIGTTLKSNTFRRMALNYMSGWIPKWTAEGNLYFGFKAFVGDEATLELEFEHDAIAVAEKDDWRTESTKLIRMIWEGSTVGTPGTTYSKKTLIVDLAGRWENFEPVGEADGNDILTGTFRVRYSSADSLKGQIVVVNELSALP